MALAVLVVLTIIGLGTVLYSLYATLESFEGTRLEVLDRSFDGLGESIRNGAKKDVTVLMLHRIGQHCIGYSEGIVKGILTELGIEMGPSTDDLLKLSKESLGEQVDMLRLEHAALIGDLKDQLETPKRDKLDDYARLLAIIQSSDAQRARIPGRPIHRRAIGCPARGSEEPATLREVWFHSLRLQRSEAIRLPIGRLQQRRQRPTQYLRRIGERRTRAIPIG
jgi:hypothetical protein